MLLRVEKTGQAWEGGAGRDVEQGTFSERAQNGLPQPPADMFRMALLTLYSWTTARACPFSSTHDTPFFAPVRPLRNTDFGLMPLRWGISVTSPAHDTDETAFGRGGPQNRGEVWRAT